MEWRGDTFTPQRPAQPPALTVTVSINHRHHEKFGKLTHQQLITQISAIADSGCQTCTAGMDFLRSMECTTSNLIATEHHIVGITNSPLGILGILFVVITLGNRTSHQMVYISKNCRGLYLSITDSNERPGCCRSVFPLPPSQCDATTKDTCDCPARTTAPCRPTQIPFPPTPDNVIKLKEWLTSTFESSAFNMCPHQPLPSMTGEPVTIHFKHDAKPHAVHTPIPVPHH